MLKVMQIKMPEIQLIKKRKENPSKQSQSKSKKKKVDCDVCNNSDTNLDICKYCKIFLCSMCSFPQGAQRSCKKCMEDESN